MPFRLWGLMRNSHIRAERVPCFGVLDGRQLALAMPGYIQLNSTQLKYHTIQSIFASMYFYTAICLEAMNAHYNIVKPTAMVYTGYSSAQWEPLQKGIHLSR